MSIHQWMFRNVVVAVVVAVIAQKYASIKVFLAPFSRTNFHNFMRSLFKPATFVTW